MKKYEKKYKETEGRNSPTRIHYFYQTDGSVLLKTTIIILLLIPSFCISCSREITEYESAEGLHKCFLAFTKVQAPVEDYLTDIFIYDNDERMGLDSYESGGRLSEKMDIVCGKGEKRLVIVASHTDSDTPLKGNALWKDTGTYSAIKKRVYSIKDENPSAPVLRGVTDSNGDCHICLKTNLNRISIKSIGKDFSGLPFESSDIEDISIYLINVAELYPLLGGDTETRITSYINKGRLREDDLKDMRHPEMLHLSTGLNIDRKMTELDAELYCFPNHCEQEDAGNVFTRLVIEGTVDGIRWYWPLDLHFDKEETGNNRELDILITGTGSTDPDIPVSSIQASIRTNITEWEKKDEKTINY